VKVLAALRDAVSRSAADRSCSSCRHFMVAARDVEACLPGLAILSSADAAVRSIDGICLHHDRVAAGTSRCDLHGRNNLLVGER
jgi:hypothetical protein